MVINTWSLTAEQVPLPVVVKVSVTLPAVISDCEGVYVGVKEVLFGRKDPLPPDQLAPVATVKAPLNEVTALFPHTVKSLPALTVGAAVNEIETWSVTALHDPFDVVVNVS